MQSDYSRRFLSKLASAVIRLAIKESTYDERKLKDKWKCQEFRQKAKMARAFIVSDSLDRWANFCNVSPESIRKFVFVKETKSLPDLDIIKEWLQSSMSVSAFANIHGFSKASMYRMFKLAGVNSPGKLRRIYVNQSKD